MENNSEKIEKARQELLRAMQKIVIKKQFLKFDELYWEIYYDNLSYLGISLDNPKLISYSRNRNDKFSHAKRVKTTLGRYIRRNKKPYCSCATDNDIDKFVGEVIAQTLNPTELFTVLRGIDIEQAYYDMVGGHTCMTEHKAKFVRIYAENPEKIGLLVLNKNEARALMWETDGKRVLIDRIYPNDGQHIALYNRYAKEQKWITRLHHGRPQKGTREFRQKYKITLKQPSNGKYPYMDSFQYSWLLLDSGLVVVTNNKNTPHETKLCRDNGIYEDNLIRCEGCNDRDLPNIRLNGLPYCRYCVSSCRECNKYLLLENLTNTNVFHQKYLCKECFNKCESCTDCGIKIITSDIRIVEKDKKICSDCFNTRYIICQRCEKIIKRSAEIYDSYYGYICQECHNKKKGKIL